MTIPRETFPSHKELFIIIEVYIDQKERSLIMEGIDLNDFTNNMIYPERFKLNSDFDKTQYNQRMFEPPFLYNYFIGIFYLLYIN